MSSTGGIGRSWSWAALAAAIVLWASAVPAFGLSAVLSPVGALLTFVAWRRSPHDALFWVGVLLNAILVLTLLVLLVGLATGETAIDEATR
ncbi:MAG TPA: hypothetical protein VE596_03515 [Gaiellaceae bacterium]|nr:hypothetical protein [Gaiellaceae bacterium]